MLALFRVYLEMQVFLSRVILLYSFPAEEQRIHVSISKLCQSTLLLETTQERGGGEAGRKWLQSPHHCQVRQRQRKHKKELSWVGVVGAGLMISPEEHTSRRQREQMKL